MIDPATVAEARAKSDRLLAGGDVVMRFGPTFWSPGFGMVKDRFGTHRIIGAQPESPGGDQDSGQSGVLQKNSGTISG